MERLQGRSAIVTGAASGIGRAVAQRFASEGARLALFDQDENGLVETEAMIKHAVGASVSVIPVAVDVSNSEQVQAAINRTIAVYSKLDVVFNGVGISGRRWGDGPVDQCAEQAWALVMNLNLTSMFLMGKYSIPWLLKTRGAVINLSSVLGMVGGDEDFATHAYAASKAGIIGLSRAMATYYAPRGVRVNVIAPGLIATPMSRRAQADPHILERLKQLQPLTGTLGTPEDVAGAAAYLASDDARFVTGTVLTVDGGWTAY